MLLEIPTTTGENISILIEQGDCVFIVGANGSGKSALIQHFVSTHRDDKIKRITAHRQTAFDSESANFTHPDREQFEQQVKNWDFREDARWKEDRNFGQQKQLAVLTDFVARENAHARSVVDLIRRKKYDRVDELAAEAASPLGQINELFRVANLTASLTLSEGGEIFAYHNNNNDASFRMAHLSDGERSAAIMAATVLIVEPGTALLIDEPERHLHRSIIEPFLSALFDQRKDCSFVVSTHEVALPLANPNARVLVTRNCRWSGAKGQAWDIEPLVATTDLPEDLKVAVLGARRRILFVEGENGSLDKALYGALFPGIMVVSKGSNSEVQKSVKGIRDTPSLHHVEAFGLIDEDGRPKDEIACLTASSIFALSVYSVESLYYCSESIAAVAQRQAESFDEEAEQLMQGAISTALERMDDELAKRMAARKSEHSIRRAILSELPNWKKLKELETTQSIDISFNSPFGKELDKFNQLLAADDLNGLVARYPLRDSDVFSKIAKALKCASKRDYEKMVVAQIRKDTEFAQLIRDKIHVLSVAIAP